MTASTSKLLLLTPIVLFVTLQQASAQGIVEAPSPSWTGGFVGMQGGIAGAKIGYVEEAIPDATEETSYRFGDQRGVLSFHAGYDQEIGERYVVGVEVDATWFDLDIDPFSAGGLGSLFSADYALGISTRAGYAISPETLIYGRAGLAAINVDAEEQFFDRANEFLPAARFGVGLETFVVDGLSARVEANYTLPLYDFDVPADFKSFDPRNLAVTAGLNWRLGASEPSTLQFAESTQDDWQGAHFGANVGYTIGQFDFDLTTPGATVGPYASEIAGFGVSAGYDFRIDDLVFGVDADIQRINADFFDPAQNSPLQGSTELVGTIDSSAMISGRAGFLANPSTLVYAKAGIGFIETTANPEFFTFESGRTERLAAQQIGVGIETILADNINLRLEGMYVRATEGLTADLTQEGQATITPSAVTARAGLVIRF